MHLTLASWNIHKCVGGVDRRYDPQRVLDVLSAYRVDICLLQEVEEGIRPGGFLRQVDIIAEGLGLRNRYFEPTHQHHRSRRYGNSIISRWPLYEHHFIDLTIGRKKSRGAVYVKSRVRVGNRSCTLALYNLHLGLAEKERGEQLKRFLVSRPFVGLHRNTPIILGGDFNDVWGRIGERYLIPEGFHRAGKKYMTFPAVMPMRPLDSLYIRGMLEVVEFFPAVVGEARKASDHLPLILKVKLLAL